MDTSIFYHIDTLIQKLRDKYTSNGIVAADAFIVLSLEILRCDLFLGKLSVNTISAMKEISATTSHFYYYRDYPEIYNLIQELYITVTKFDSRLTDADFESMVNFKLDSWTKNLADSSSDLLSRLPMTFFAKHF